MNIPQNNSAEMSTLGSMLLSESAIEYCVDYLHDDDFFTVQHKTIFDCVRGMYNKNLPVDAVSVATELNNIGKLKDAGDIGYLTDLIKETPSPSSVKYYAERVKECSARRKIIKTGQLMYKNGQEISIPIDELLEDAEKSIFSLMVADKGETLSLASEMILEVDNHIQNLQKNKGNADGAQTGFLDIDKQIGCLRNSELVILAARPGVGKTSLAMNIVQNVVFRSKKTAAVFSLEMPKIELLLRLCATETCVDLNKILTGELTEKEDTIIRVQLSKLADVKLFIDDNPALSIPKIRSKCRKLKAKHGLDLVVIDYLQLMRSTGKAERRDLEIANITREAKLLARELNTPILMLSQLSRKAEDGEKPRLTDLRESGAIEQDADKVIFIYSYEDGKAQINVSKNRNGPKCEISLAWRPEIVRFDNLWIQGARK